ncbi:MAG TPA: RNA methyltransferase [Microbacteriaceae bacterium]|nr:RNA methyltransferase [Microbacteriaceae bacterium]
MLENPKSARVKSAAKLLKKRARRERAEFLVEGPQAVKELLENAPELTKEVFATHETLERHSELELLTARHNIELTLADSRVIAALSDTINPQGVVAVAKTKVTDLNEALAQAKLVAVLVEVRDPGNAGTVLRAADAAGADCVIFAGESIDPWHPKVVRSTTGSLFHLPLVTDVTLLEVLEATKQAGITSLAADLQGRDLSPGDTVLRNPIAWIFGNEARGLSETDRGRCDDVLKLPIFGRAQSLNLATAASVCLYTSAFAQRAAAQ